MEVERTRLKCILCIHWRNDSEKCGTKPNVGDPVHGNARPKKSVSKRYNKQQQHTNHIKIQTSNNIGLLQRIMSISSVAARNQSLSILFSGNFRFHFFLPRRHRPDSFLFGTLLDAVAIQRARLCGTTCPRVIQWRTWAILCRSGHTFECVFSFHFRLTHSRVSTVKFHT